jgi:hypothetical protein
MANNLVPITLKPLSPPPASQASPLPPPRPELGAVGRAIRQMLDGEPIINPVTLEDLENIVATIANDARALMKGGASFWGLTLLSLSICDALGSAFGIATPSNLIASILIGSWASSSWYITFILLLQVATYSGGLLKLRSSPWRYWIRRAFQNAIPACLGGDEPANHVRDFVNIAGTVLAILFVVTTADQLTKGRLASLVLSIPAGPLLFLVLKTVLPVAATRDRAAAMALAASATFCGIVALTGSAGMPLAGEFPYHQTPLGSFITTELWLGYAGIIGILGVLLGSWHQSQVFRVRLDGPNTTSPSVYLPHLVNLPVATTDVEFDGGAPYIVLTRRPVDEQRAEATGRHPGVFRTTAYKVRQPLERIRLNDEEIAVHNLASLSTLQAADLLTTGSSTTVLIRVPWPHASALAKRLGGSPLSQETSEWLSAQLSTTSGLRSAFERAIPALAEIPKARLNDQIADAMVKFARLATDLNRPIPEHVRASGQRLVDRVITLADRFVAGWDTLDAIRSKSDAIAQEVSREHLVSTWRTEFGKEVRSELSTSYKGVLSREAAIQVSTLLQPIEDAVISNYIQTTLNFDSDLAAIRMQRSELESHFKLVRDSLRDRLDAAIAEEEVWVRSIEDDERRHEHERDLVILGALREAVARSNVAARDIIQAAKNRGLLDPRQPRPSVARNGGGRTSRSPVIDGTVSPATSPEPSPRAAAPVGDAPTNGYKPRRLKVNYRDGGLREGEKPE